MSKIENTTLVVSNRPFPERELVIKEWASQGGSVFHVDRFWRSHIPLNWEEPIAIYGTGLFCRAVAETMGRKLVTPSNTILPELPYTWVKRDIVLTTLGGALGNLRGRKFIKPVRQKIFEAKVYHYRKELEEQCAGLPLSTPVIVSEPVHFHCEVRFFLSKGAIAESAQYRGIIAAMGVIDFTRNLANEVELPGTLVIDVGFIDGRGWALIEMNPCWGACLRGCRAQKVVDCIADATVMESA